jgi:hypothetical protein
VRVPLAMGGPFPSEAAVWPEEYLQFLMCLKGERATDVSLPISLLGAWNPACRPMPSSDISMITSGPEEHLGLAEKPRELAGVPLVIIL